MPRNFETMFCHPDYHIEPYVDPTPVVFADEHAVAGCLLENGDYDGYLYADTFTEEAVFAMAREDARAIIAAREQRQAERQYLGRLLIADRRRAERQKQIADTRYPATVTPVDVSA